LRMRLSLSILI